MPSLMVPWCQGDFSGQGSFIQILFTCNSCDPNLEWELAPIVICQACNSTSQREWAAKVMANPLDSSADRWLTCLLTGNLFYTLLQCAPQPQSSAVDLLSFAFQTKGKRIHFTWHVTAATTLKQDRIWWVTSMLVDLQTLELLLPVPSSWTAVCLSKTHPSKPYRCFWLAPSGVMSCRPSFIPVFRAFCCARVKDKAVAIANSSGDLRKAEDLFHSCDTKGQLEKLVSCMLGGVMDCTAVSIYVLTGSKWCFAREF